jgi:UDP-N-acetylmuramyl tripeptide synthase
LQTDLENLKVEQEHQKTQEVDRALQAAKTYTALMEHINGLERTIAMLSQRNNGKSLDLRFLDIRNLSYAI